MGRAKGVKGAERGSRCASAVSFCSSVAIPPDIKFHISRAQLYNHLPDADQPGEHDKHGHHLGAPLKTRRNILTSKLAPENPPGAPLKAGRIIINPHGGSRKPPWNSTESCKKDIFL